ncbi:MAG TPA: T9SS type A sorting domain-containing protein, partial [Bacteroidia bacterium]|nr:T9SS type A sorting domain-containing protein [Bacteroidia bacterium]
SPISNPPSLSLFPNPNTGAFTLKAKSEELRVKSVEIYNVLGEKVYSNSYQPSANSYQLDLTSQPSGVYLYRVMDDSGALVGEGKFVIEK